MVEESAPFAVRPTDVRGVSAALSSAERSWQRGERTAVVRWLQRASEAAIEASDDGRALELAECARELARQITAHKRGSDPGLTALVSPPTSVHLLTKLAQPRSATPPSSQRPASVRADSRGRLPTGFEEDTNQVAIFQLRDELARRAKEEAAASSGGPPPLPASARRSSPPVFPPGEVPTRAHARDEWLIETVAGTDSAPDVFRSSEEPPSTVPPPPVAALPAPRAISASRVPVYATVSVRVLLWRDETGALYVTTSSEQAPPHAMSAMLTALDPGADLVGLLDDEKPRT